jgi:hypothetical protein
VITFGHHLSAGSPSGAKMLSSQSAPACGSGPPEIRKPESTCIQVRGLSVLVACGGSDPATFSLPQTFFAVRIQEWESIPAKIFPFSHIAMSPAAMNESVVTSSFLNHRLYMLMVS